MSKPLMVLLIIAAAAAAYVLGTRDGKSRYQEIGRAAKDFWDDPAVAKVRTKATKAVEKAADRAAARVG